MVLVVVGPYLEKLVIDRAILPDQPSLLLPLVGLIVLVGLFKAVGIGADGSLASSSPTGLRPTSATGSSSKSSGSHSASTTGWPPES